jgi:nucleotide-binding universal stress UspA family protein
MDEYRNDYHITLDDFHSARRRAAMDAILSRITGKSPRMMQYDQVRKGLGGLESANRKLMDIPLDSIVGTVGRYNDFNRKLLPLNNNDAVRWAQVRKAIENSIGLPPIEVYQVGDAYFILDGHHRASIAREFGAKQIQAYVREVHTRVPLSPTDQPEDLILKSEYTDFLKQTHVDELIPTAKLEVSIPGSYGKLLEHISVHRYFMGIDENRPVKYDEAIIHWYEQVYQPVAQVILQRNILHDFPGRTEADLYLWIMDHRTGLEDEIGWKVSTSKAATDLIAQFSPTFYNFTRRLVTRFFDLITPDQLEIQPSPGLWRKQKGTSTSYDGLFENILVAVTGDSAGWTAVELAAGIARRENAILIGVHVLRRKIFNDPLIIQERFNEICEAAGVNFVFITVNGNVTRSIFERTFWSDLLVLRLSYPPPILSFRRFGSGLRTLIRLTHIPILVVPPSVSAQFTRALLAYGGGPKADEALFMAAYFANRWNTEIVVVTVRRDDIDEHELAKTVRNYFESRHVLNASYIEMKNISPGDAILRVTEEKKCDLIFTGGYEGSYFHELIFGSNVDRVLQNTKCSVLICH